MQALYELKDEYGGLWKWVYVPPKHLTGAWKLEYDPFNKQWDMYIQIKPLWSSRWVHEDSIKVMETHPTYYGNCP